MTRRRRTVRLAGAALALAALAGCATTAEPADPEGLGTLAEVNDPLEPMNRAVFAFNLQFDRFLLEPVADTYAFLVPDLMRQGVRNVLRNLRSPMIFANDVLQGDMERAGDTFGRFLTNTIIGLGGLFDVAAGDNPEAGIPFHDEDFGQTLAVWGVPDGPYLMLPFFGPSNPRDTSGIVVDAVADPVGDYVSGGQLGLSAALFGLRAVDARARYDRTIEQLEESSLDFYATVRSLYRQRRAAEIANESEQGLAPAPEMLVGPADFPMEQQDAEQSEGERQAGAAGHAN